MAALLVAMAVMAVMTSVALPAWSHLIRLEKEEELIFRGNQYARAIGLYQRKYANASPPDLDALVKERFLRKKFRDPLSPNEDGEFQLLYVGTDTGAGARGRSGEKMPGEKPPMTGSSGFPNSALAKTSGPIRGVASKNTGQSIRTFNGKTRYNEWEFVGLQQSTQAGGGAGRSGPQRGGSQGGGGGRNPGSTMPGRIGGMPPDRGSGTPPGGVR
jgi:type II secretory pathway pseudopilin PulG